MAAFEGVSTKRPLNVVRRYVMPKPKHGLSNWILLLSMLTSGGIALGTTMPSTGWKIVSNVREDKERLITRQKADSEPYEVFEYLVKGTKAAREGESFVEDATWLKNLKFTIRNKSEQPITFKRVHVAFLETKLTGLLHTYPFDIGHSLIDPVKRGQPIRLAKNETVIFEITDKRFDILKGLWQRAGYESNDISKAEFTILQVEFADKSMWFAQQWFRFNDYTGKMERISP